MKNEIEEIKDLIKQAEERLAKLETKQEFNDGDIVTVENKHVGKLIAIIKTNEIKAGMSINDYYAAVGFIGMLEYNNAFGYHPANGDTVRHATPKEAQILFDALAKDGKKWNPETKQIEKLRWRAEISQPYWYLDTWLQPDITNDYRYKCDYKKYEANNYFRTREECQAFCDKVKTLANGND